MRAASIALNLATPTRDKPTTRREESTMKKMHFNRRPRKAIGVLNTEDRELTDAELNVVAGGAKEKVDDDQSQVQFLIQVGTSDLQGIKTRR
jgi:hypothetical protein